MAAPLCRCKSTTRPLSFRAPVDARTRNVRDVTRSIEKFGNIVPTIGVTRPERAPRRLSASERICCSYSRISGTGGSAPSFTPKQITAWPLPGDTVLPVVSGLVDAPELNAVSIAERWLYPT